jgi:hypothetical protein
MADDPRDRQIAGYIDSIAARSEHEGERLAWSMISRSWPDASDCTVPAAREWVRRWGPRGLAPIPPACSCAVGRCGVCN